MSAERQRAYRARKGARTGQLGPAPTAACGTVSAYKRHLRRGEEPDVECRAAWAAYHRGLYASRVRGGTRKGNQ